MWQDALRIMKDYLPHKVTIHGTVYSQLNVCNWIFLFFSWTSFKKRWLPEVERK